MSIEELIHAYMVCRSNKRRTDDSIMYEIRYERNLVRLLSDINSRTLQPTAYSFITLKPRPREVFAADMDTRIVHHYIDIRMRDLISRRLTDRTFNNRIGYGLHAAVNRFIEDLHEVSDGFTSEAWVISADLKAFFPNISQDIVYGKLREVVAEDYHGDNKDDLRYLLQVAIYSNPTRHSYRKSPLHAWEYLPHDKSLYSKPDGTGGALGCLIWQNASNYLLNDFDHMMVDTYGFHYVRYVDDMRWIVNNKDTFLPMMQEFRKHLEDIHCQLHPRKFSCQRATAKHSFVGIHIAMDRIHCNRRVRKNAMKAVCVINRMHPRVSAVGTVLASFNSYTGIFRSMNETGMIIRMNETLSDRWKRYVHLDDRRMCFMANDGFGYKRRLAIRYGISYNKINRKRHGNKKKNQRTGAAPAGAEGRNAEVGRARTEMRQVRT